MKVTQIFTAVKNGKFSVRTIRNTNKLVEEFILELKDNNLHQEAFIVLKNQHILSGVLLRKE
jgi:hypothetical protein